MKAALLVRPGEMVIGEVPDPEPGPGDVRVAVGGVGLCGSDLAVFRGTWSPPAYPWIQGHEAFGRIDRVGEGVPPVRIGETVVVEPNVPCGDCRQCALHRTSACARRGSVGMNRPGALAELLVVPSAHAWAIDGVADADLACVEPLAVVEAALRRLGADAPADALVLGAGSQGLLMCQALVARGTEVLAYDLNAGRLEVAVELGANTLRVEAATEVDLVVDTVGNAATMAMAVRHAAIGGTILVLGLDATPLEVTAQAIVRRHLTIRGSLTYDHPDDFASTVARVRDHVVAPGRVITDEVPLAEAPRAFRDSATARGKTWIRVGSGA